MESLMFSDMFYSSTIFPKTKNKKTSRGLILFLCGYLFVCFTLNHSGSVAVYVIVTREQLGFYKYIVLTRVVILVPLTLPQLSEFIHVQFCPPGTVLLKMRFYCFWVCENMT